MATSESSEKKLRSRDLNLGRLGAKQVC